jgi:hypothetical protein
MPYQPMLNGPKENAIGLGVIWMIAGVTAADTYTRRRA